MPDYTMLSKVPVPVFKTDNYEMYEHHMEVWAEVCGVEKTKQEELTMP